MKKKILIILVSLLVFIPSVNASSAKTLAELRKELTALKNKKAKQE